jgi:prepilin-type N-terminal cleavage/methylation domain-containing protein
MKAPRNGFTVIELVIVLAIIGIIAALILSAGGCGSPAKAKDNARAFCSDLGYSVTGISCAETDSDGDGYISCSVLAEDKAGAEVRLQLECSGGSPWRRTGGCKERVGGEIARPYRSMEQ